MKTEFQQLRSEANNDESVALQNACETLNCLPEHLLAEHTEENFVFKLNGFPGSETTLAENENDNQSGTKTEEVEDKEDTFTVEKRQETTLQSAKKEAMAYFDTFEGNIKIVDQDETHFVFAKVRQ